MIKSEKEDLEDQFGDVFHSFRDLHKVSPDQFLRKLESKGIILARKSKRSAAMSSTGEPNG